MYTRKPEINKEKIKVPENYGGSMFRGTPSFYETFATPTRADDKYDIDIQNADTNDKNEPDVSENIKSGRSVPDDEDISVSKEYHSADLPENDDQMYENPNEKQTSFQDEYGIHGEASEVRKKNSLFSGMLFPGMLEKHFPFGHGIGSEELLIMGIMLMVYMSYDKDKESDGDLMLMLAMLLFAG